VACHIILNLKKKHFKNSKNKFKNIKIIFRNYFYYIIFKKIIILGNTGFDYQGEQRLASAHASTHEPDLSSTIGGSETGAKAKK